MQNQSISNKTKAKLSLFWLSCFGCEHTVNALVNQTKEFKMSALSGLKFVSAKRPQNVAPVVQRRNKLSNQLWEQMELARAFSEGKTYAPTRYGTRVLELAKGKNSIEIGNANELFAVLETVKKCVENGELDTQIEAASAAVRERFAL